MRRTKFPNKIITCIPVEQILEWSKDGKIISSEFRIDLTKLGNSSISIHSSPPVPPVIPVHGSSTNTLHTPLKGCVHHIGRQHTTWWGGINSGEEKKLKIKKEVEVPNKKNKLPPIKKEDNQFLPIARKLSDIIRLNKNIIHTPSQVRAWTREIKKLVQSGVSVSRLKIVLRWYEKNIGGEFIPVIESGKSLRTKFIKLESAMERDKGIIPKQETKKNANFTNPVWKIK